MQFKIALVTAAIATLAVAATTPRANGCSTGLRLCCEHAQSVAEVAKDPELIAQLKHFGINTKDLTGFVGDFCAQVTDPEFTGCYYGRDLCCTNYSTAFSTGCTLYQ
ncbi:hypothetical protein BDP27DRAFT_1338996 [Rhodocollybia butyracea]|uniref:Hydrophobin n=1 Tax=Rhodocollybia butyracea TaxID=206335 RepID=A0A9P5U016_9AGAR|nr:hypothetical protein BDP27DRAFT_1338996 [Rhodocollybia butyracea]